MPSAIVRLEDFRARYPEFDGIANIVVELKLEDAEADTSASFFGATHARAISALAAHRMSISLDESGNALGGQPGPLSAASADGVSSTYVVPDGLSPQDAALWSTVYGQTYLELRRRGGPGVIVAC